MKQVSFLLLCALFVGQVRADEGPNHYEAPGLNAGRDYISQHFAESIDPFSGNLQLHYTDLLIPGNGGFDIRVERSYNLLARGDVQSPYGRGWDIHFGRVRHLAGENICSLTASTPKSLVLELPDGSRQTFFKSNGSVPGTANMFLTTSLWRGQCDLSGGMIVHSPSGTKYEMTLRDDSAAYWHAAKITDRNGNSATFSYINLAGYFRKVVSAVNIPSASPLISFSYSSNRLGTIVSQGRTLTYTVSVASDGSGSTLLTNVRTPANTNWQYQYYLNRGTVAGSYSLQSLTFPQGGDVTYNYGFVTFPVNVLQQTQATVVTSKVTSDGSWTYAYTPGSGSSLDQTVATLTSGSTGTRTTTYRHFGYASVANGTVWKIGLLSEKRSGSLQTETMTWTASPAISNEPTTPTGYQKLDNQTFRPHLSQRQIARDGATYTTTHSDFDAYGNPGTVTEAGNKTRTHSLTYVNNTTAWILGQQRLDTVGGTEVSRREYDAKGNVTDLYKFGVRTQFGYDSTTGALSSKTDARGKVTTYLSYFRGVPQTENRQEAVTISRSVDNFGNITSESDGISPWGYSYDGLNRLTSIDPPAGTSSSITWSTASKAIQRGGYFETHEFDGYGREDRVTRDGVVSTITIDALGRRKFESYPGSSSGLTYIFDDIGRVTSVQSPAGTKLFTFTSGNATSVRNERLNTTVYSYDRYGNPDEGYLNKIDAPENTTVLMPRDTFGFMESATQGGLTRTYGYSPQKFLTSVNDPETGTTTLVPDAVGNVTSKTVGGAQTNYAYDDLNRLETITLVLPTRTVAFEYNKRSQVTKVTNDTTTVRDYTYDANGNLTQDKLTVDGNIFAADLAYDGLDSLTTLTYDDVIPSASRALALDPDVRGRPRKVGDMISSVSYRASGNLNTVVYGNNISTTFGEHGTRQLPTSIFSTGTIDLGYTYDEVGNVTRIVDTGLTKDFGYDGVDRLTSASGIDPGSGSSLTYSSSGNITLQRYGSYQVNYVYNSGTNRLTSVTIGGGPTRTYDYDLRGNATTNGRNQFAYDTASNLTCVDCGLSSQIKYGYDGKGQRVWQEKAGKKTYFHQLSSGDLLVEYMPFGKNWKQHGYLRGKRIATRSGTNASATSTSLSGASSAPYGTGVVFNVGVSPTAATGTVNLMDGATQVATITLASGAGSASLSTLPVGAHSLTAAYSGDANYQPSSSTALSLAIVKRNSGTVLSANPSTTSLGQQMTLTATVTGTGPGGQVTFSDGATTLGVVALTTVSATVSTATLSISTISAGNSKTLTATYAGDANHNGSTGQVQVTVAQGSASVSLVSNIPSPAAGQAITFTSTVIGAAGFVPSGTVTLMAGALNLGSGSLVSGTRSLVVNTLGAGSHQITSSYSGDGNYPAAASNTITQVVNKASSATSLTVPNEPIYANQLVTLSATVTGFNPTGVVRFLNGGSEFASVNLSGGSASVSLPAPVGQHTLSAAYDGDVNNLSSASSIVTRTVLRRAQRDFNGDGKSDLLFFHPQAGSVVTWWMNGAQIDPNSPGFVGWGPEFDIVGTGDFNGDGKADLLLRRASDGLYYIRLIDGATALAEPPSGPLGVITSDWQVRAIADFNGDGKSDVLWFNPTAGYVVVMWMDGAQILPNSPGFAIDLAYEVVGAGDFNGDGMADILEYRASDNQYYIQMIDGATALPEPPSGPFGQITPDWQVKAIADFNGDGKADLLWFSPAAGYAIVFWMNGTQILPDSPGFYVGSDFAAVGSGDFNGDGIADILWYRASDQTLYIQLINGGTAFPEPPSGTVGQFGGGFELRGLGAH